MTDALFLRLPRSPQIIGHEQSTNERIIFVLEFLFRQSGTSPEAVTAMHSHFRTLLREVVTLGVESDFEVDTKQRDPRALNTTLFNTPQAQLQAAGATAAPVTRKQQQHIQQQHQRHRQQQQQQAAGAAGWGEDAEAGGGAQPE